jgi:TctA family transporter
VFGVLGYIFLRFRLDPAPLILGFILGPMLEENFRRAMLISRGSFEPFVTRPISAVLVGMIFLFFAWQLFLFIRDLWKPRVTVSAIASSSAPALREMRQD